MYRSGEAMRAVLLDHTRDELRVRARPPLPTTHTSPLLELPHTPSRAEEFVMGGDETRDHIPPLQFRSVTTEGEPIATTVPVTGLAHSPVIDAFKLPLTLNQGLEGTDSRTAVYELP